MVTRKAPATPASTPATGTAAAAAVKKAPARKAAKRPARKPPAAPPAPTYGAVETATRAELERLHMTESALAQSAILLAHLADESDSAPATAQLVRELRMTLTNVRGLVGELFAVDEKDGAVVPPSRLENLRKKAAARGRPSK